MNQSPILRYSSRRTYLDRTFLSARLSGAHGYDRIARYFSSSLLELVGEALDTVSGKIRVVSTFELDLQDTEVVKIILDLGYGRDCSAGLGSEG